MADLFSATLPLHHSGALLALIASCCWTFAPFLFASAVRSIGPYYANFWRLIMASCALWIIALIVIMMNPATVHSITPQSIGWMAVSGIAGLTIGDLFYFKALTYLGPRRTLQILCGVPIVSAIGALLFLDERLSMFASAGITLTVGAILTVNWFDKKEMTTAEPGSFSYIGLGLAILGTLCQGAGAVLMRKAYLSTEELNTIVAAAIRISSAGCATVLLALISGRIAGAKKAVPSAKAFGRLAGGTALGPVLGMLFYVASLKFAAVGIASTMSSLSPILVIPISAWRYKTRLNWPALIAMMIAVGGVILIFRK
jgi:drug/metabolite transporter (DMT)-like permease